MSAADNTGASKKSGNAAPAQLKPVSTKRQVASAVKRIPKKVIHTPVTSSTNQRMKPTAALFWKFVVQQEKMSETERLNLIRKGLSMSLPMSMCAAFNMKTDAVANALNISSSTLKRYIINGTPLNLSVSERIDRIADLTREAARVFESRDETVSWLSRPHPILINQTPIGCCVTELGTRQVRKILSAIEWGNTA
ncbi:MAG: DUF2384 domain-containing protein [Pseudohongiella sp.]|nr:DUF2384 domain-containing protein [Pseudohongiella sp.]